MKSFFKKCVLTLLERLAAWRLRKIQPRVIGITGSVGKTSTKEAVFQVISSKNKTHRNLKSLNTEFGALLTILEQESGYSSPLKWVSILWHGFWGTLTLRERPYETLILEMGADKPGDIGYLVKHIPPQIGILTNVKEVHMAEGQFPSVDAIFEEKSKLIKALTNEGIAILNADDERVAALSKTVHCHVLTFGISPKADVRATDIEATLKGLRFIVHAKQQSHAFHFPHLLGAHNLYVVLPAIAVGLTRQLSLTQIERSLYGFSLPPGRMNLILGVHGATIIDSSYNASPDAMKAALQFLKTTPGRHIAALGSMNELGKKSHEMHLKIGKLIPQYADFLVTVGVDARYFGEAAQATGLAADHIHSFEDPLSAAKFLEKQLKKGDIVLVKGSQNNVRMEHFVKRLMQDPQKAKMLLVRQDDYWQTH